MPDPNQIVNKPFDGLPDPIRHHLAPGKVESKTIEQIEADFKADAKARFLEDIEKRFTYQTPSSDGVRRAHELVGHVTKIAAMVLARHLPSSRELSLAMTSLEAARMQANQAVALTQHEIEEGALIHVKSWMSPLAYDKPFNGEPPYNFEVKPAPPVTPPDLPMPGREAEG